MASIYSYTPLSLIFLFFSLYSSMAALVKQQPLILKYHNGPLLSGKIAVNLIWYGNFTPTQRSIIVDFISSLSSPLPPPPSAASWWRTTAKYTRRPSTLAVGDQILYQNYPFGKTLKNSDLLGLASKPKPRPTMDGSIHVVLTAADVAVEGFCMRCGTHGWTGGPTRMAYIWVGNSVNQCPGQCAWPFHQPIYGPQTAPLVPPNGDVGVDGMVINLGKLLAGTVTNPYSNGYFQGPAAAPLEAATACTGVFGSGAYPGYTGRVMVDDVSGASYNAQGVKGRRFMLPAMWDPQSLGCATLV